MHRRNRVAHCGAVEVGRDCLLLHREAQQQRQRRHQKQWKRLPIQGDAKPQVLLRLPVAK